LERRAVRSQQEEENVKSSLNVSKGFSVRLCLCSSGVLKVSACIFLFRALNYEQQTAKVLVQEGHNVFITGKAGTGKTFLLSHLCDDMKTEGKIVSVTCTTGIACKSLPPALQATTLHSFAGIKDGSGSLTQLLERIDGNPGAKHRWRTTEVLVIDEVSMLSDKIFNHTEYIARNVRQESRAFGGIQVVASGDFFNCLRYRGMMTKAISHSRPNCGM